MRVMTRKQTDVLEKLVRLAYGDRRLVEEAIRRVADNRGVSDLDRIISYIEKNRHERETAA